MHAVARLLFSQLHMTKVYTALLDELMDSFALERARMITARCN